MNFATHPPPPPPQRFASTARCGTFFTYFFLILTLVNHLLEFQYSRYANYSLIMQKYQKQGLQGLVVLVPLYSIPVSNRFWRVVPVSLWVVPVPICHYISGTGTGLRFCPEMVEFTIFLALFFHNSLLFHPSSKTNMESLQTTSQTLLISQRIQGFIPKLTKLHKTIHL